MFLDCQKLGFHVPSGIVVRYNLQRRVVMDGRIVARYYIMEGSMAADVLSTLPAIVQVGICDPLFLGFQAFCPPFLLRIRLYAVQ